MRFHFCSVKTGSNKKIYPAVTNGIEKKKTDKIQRGFSLEPQKLGGRKI